MRVRPWTVLVVLAFLGLVGCDHATKHVATTTLRGEAPRPVVGHAVELTYQENPGVAFNTERVLPAPLRTPLIVVVGCAALAGLAIALYRRRGQVTVEVAAFVLIAGGAAGNLFDRLIRGHVVDFIHVQHWPVWNLADAFLAIGVGLMLLAAWRARPAEPPPRTA